MEVCAGADEFRGLNFTDGYPSRTSIFAAVKPLVVGFVAIQQTLNRESPERSAIAGATALAGG